MNQELVSVAMATCNGEKYILSQLESIAAQTYKNIELVISDDLSDDSTLDIINNFKFPFPVKVLVNQSRLGFVKNFGKAISFCSGKYVALSDQDDIWDERKIEILVREIGSHSLICSDASVIDGNGDVIFSSLSEISGHYQTTDDQFKFFVFRNYVTGHTALLHRSLVEKALPIPDGIIYHDWWFANVASVFGGVKYLDLRLTKYRQHAENVCGASCEKGLWSKYGEFCRKKKDGFAKDIENAKAMLSSDVFCDAHRMVILEKIAFAESLSTGLFHFRAFIVAVKYRKYILAGKGFVFRLFFYIACLIS